MKLVKCDWYTKWVKCDGYTKVNEVNMCMIDTQNEDMCDRYRKWKCVWWIQNMKEV